MPSWAFKTTVPSGISFDGQIVYDSTLLQIPNTLKKYVQSIDVYHTSYNLVKHTGFEAKIYRKKNTSGTDLEAELSIMLVGDLPRWLQAMFVSLARACVGAGITVDFYDDWATDKQYTGYWVNASDFVDNSELLCGGSIDMQCIEIQDV